MPRHLAPPRLYLRKRSGRPDMWVILDRGREVSTMLFAHQELEAATSLKDYCEFAGVQPAPVSPPQVAEKIGWIYFITSTEKNYPIKVGFTEGEVSDRLSQLQIASPYPLIIIASRRGPISVERAILKKFHEIRLEGEWLRPTRRLVHYIERYFLKDIVSWRVKSQVMPMGRANQACTKREEA